MAVHSPLKVASLEVLPPPELPVVPAVLGSVPESVGSTVGVLVVDGV